MDYLNYSFCSLKVTLIKHSLLIKLYLIKHSLYFYIWNKRQKMKKTRTHGELWYIWKQNVNSLEYKFDYCKRTTQLGDRMSKQDAVIYYGNKCKEVFKNLGFMVETIETIDFSKHIEMACLEVRKATNLMIRREVRKIVGYLGVQNG